MLTGILKNKFVKAEKLFMNADLPEAFRIVFNYCIAFTALENEVQPKIRASLKPKLDRDKKTLTSSLKTNITLRNQIAQMTQQSETCAVAALVQGLGEWACPKPSAKTTVKTRKR